MGRFDSAARTADQTTYALFWNGATASYLWVRAALLLIDEQGRDDNGDSDGYWGGRRHNPLLEHARLLATVTVAMADASIACWDAKDADAFWRPITAIRDEDDGNPLTVPDPEWMPLFATPAHPEYPSGHSCVSGAAAEYCDRSSGTGRDSRSILIR